MGFRKYNKAEPLNRLIGVRVSAAFHDSLEAQRKNTNCQTIGEFVRQILLRNEIIYYHKDASMDDVSAELSAIRKELNSIGTNINQVTRYFNSASLPRQKIFYALKIVEDYQKVTGELSSMLAIISKITQKWSPK